MNLQLELAPAQLHSATSIAAAQAIQPKLGELCRQVLAYLRLAGSFGGTDEELQTGLLLDGSTERPRRVTLVEYGLVVDSGRTRKTKSGRDAVVWQAVL